MYVFFAVLQAIVLLQYVSGFIDKRKKDSNDVSVEAVAVEITKFLEMLVNNVDLKAGNAVDLLKTLQNSKLSKKCRKIVANTVSCKRYCNMMMIVFCRLTLEV